MVACPHAGRVLSVELWGGGGLPLSDPSFTCAKLDPNGREIYISVTIVEKNLAGLLSRMVRS